MEFRRSIHSTRVFLETRLYQPAENTQISNTDLINGLKGIVCESLDTYISFLPQIKLPGLHESGCWAMVRNSDNRIRWLFQKGDITTDFLAYWMSNCVHLGVDISVQNRYGPLREKIKLCRGYQRIFACLSEDGSIPLHLFGRLTDQLSEYTPIIALPSTFEEILKTMVMERLSTVFYASELFSVSCRITCSDQEGKEGDTYIVIDPQDQTHDDGQAYYTHRLELWHKINGKIAEAFCNSAGGERIEQCLSYLFANIDWKHPDWFPWMHYGSRVNCEYRYGPDDIALTYYEQNFERLSNTKSDTE